MQFTKYHGLGNDFVVVDVDSATALDAARARKICDRHFGVGADGVLLVSPSSRALAKMTVLNADGSQPEMCGNGLRCVALHLSRRHHAPDHFPVETDAGVLDCRLKLRENTTWITISLGRARHQESLKRDVDGSHYHFHRISMGNPHAISFAGIPELSVVDRVASQVSASLPDGSNVEFVRPLSQTQLQVVVWERGVGRTLACGTGAGAVAAAAALEGLSPFDQPLLVDLPGGSLEIRVRQDDLHVQLSGPARLVFEGELADI